MAVTWRHSSVDFVARFIRGSGRAARGLFAGRDVGFGNKVSHSERKTRRKWKPNVQKKRLWSDILDDWVRFNVTTHALRCIDKAGGLDNYLLHTKNLNSISGEKTRQQLIEKMKDQQAS
mmetsp:Transcript_21154/g.27752  ORF Transcript_21154/g.27752 Transcript_21154/m.27752 type:complete len:119 (+) Transcript_21154:90-446(+)